MLQTKNNGKQEIGAVHILYNARVICVIWGRGCCISYCYITQPDFFHRDPTSWAIHEYSENKKNGLLTDADRNVC